MLGLFLTEESLICQKRGNKRTPLQKADQGVLARQGAATAALINSSDCFAPSLTGKNVAGDSEPGVLA